MNGHFESAAIVDVSVVIPAFNEEESIVACLREVAETMSCVGRPHEIIVVDDGSTDGTFAALRDMKRQMVELVIIRFDANHGQTAAFDAGFKAARGKVIVTMDADLQNDPADIPKLVARLDEGYDVVSGWRRNRKDKLLSRKFPSWMAN